MELLWFVGATPSPYPGFEGDPNQVTPGVIGFVFTFLVAIATLALIVDMVRRVRRIRYRAEVREQLVAEIAEREAAGSAASPEPAG